MNLQNTILEQNKHWQEKRAKIKYIERDIIKNLKLKSNFIEVITGARRSGKSTIFYILIDNLIKNKQAKSKEILMVNFDNPNFIPFYKNPAELDKIIETAEILTQTKIKYLFLDEIQNIAIWEKWIKAKYDGKIFKKIFITGSNSNLLTSQYISRLSGRYFNHINYPFSFKEFLKSQNQKYYRDPIKNFPIKNKLTGLFNKYLKQGGFPEIVITEDLDILKIYYQTILLKDVIDNNKVKNSLALKQIAYFLISNVANFYSYNNIAKNLGIHENTVKEYIGYLKQSYLFSELKKYDYSIKKQNINKRKIYCVDNGFINQIGFNFSADNGRYLENLIFIELKTRKKECFYHKDKYECDFIIKQNNNIKQAIQVCYEINKKNQDREFNGLLEAMDAYKLKKGIIITHNQDKIIQLNKKKIALVSAWKWMLNNEML
ncbi:MAG: ATP-binding protein [Patescibacteria group bacterium]|nr:ATP-binding protein [Patescibacteria group bacterium]